MYFYFSGLLRSLFLIFSSCSVANKGRVGNRNGKISQAVKKMLGEKRGGGVVSKIEKREITIEKIELMKLRFGTQGS